MIPVNVLDKYKNRKVISACIEDHVEIKKEDGSIAKTPLILLFLEDGTSETILGSEVRWQRLYR